MNLEIATAIEPSLLFLLPILYAIGEMIKRTPIKNWMIPFILWGASVFIVTVYLFSQEISVQNIFVGFIQGTILAMTTVGGNQFYKQATEKRIEDENGGPGGYDDYYDDYYNHH
ncbi:MAG: hypothetical protein GX304_02700 [Clostridiales bacterium]|jgi:uncharacterized membrane protein|nr:hypothetical protein [Clostridiales bacterium]